MIGTYDVMEEAQNSFISSSNWTEKIGPTSALATIQKHHGNNVPEHLMVIGLDIQKGWKEAAISTGLRVQVTAIPPLSMFSFDYDNEDALATLFCQEMLARGFLAATTFYTTYAHQPLHIESYLQLVLEVFETMAQAMEDESVEQLLRGPIRHSGFHRLT